MTPENIDFEKVLEQSIEQMNQYAEGNKDNVEIIAYKINQLPKIDIDTVKKLRNDLDITQRTFGDVMGVSARTVESWEIGRSTPNGSATRLMQLMEKNPPLKKSLKKAIEKEKSDENDKHLV